MNRYNLLLSMLLAVFAVNIAAHAPQTKTSSYQLTKEEYLPVFVQAESETKIEPTPAEEKLQLTVEELNDYQRNDIVSSMLADYGKDNVHHNVTNPTFAKKLELVCGGNNPHQSLLAHLNQDNVFTTDFGRWVAANMLNNPTSDVAVLRQRQDVIKFFASLNENELEQITTLFDDIQQAQSGALSYWIPEPFMNLDAYRPLYYGKLFGSDYLNYGKWLNDSPLALEISTRLRNLTNTTALTYPIWLPIAVTSGTLYKLSREMGDSDPMSASQALVEGTKICGKTAKFIAGQLWSIASPFRKAFKNPGFDKALKEFRELPADERWGRTTYYHEESGEYLYTNKFDEILQKHISPAEYIDYQQKLGSKNIVSSILDNKDFSFRDILYLIDKQCIKEDVAPWKAKLGLALYASLPALMYYSVAKPLVAGMRQNTATTNYLHQRLIHVATIVRHGKTLYEYLSANEATASMPAAKILSEFYGETATISGKLKKLVGMLQTNTFVGEPSFFTLTGRVLAAHTLMSEESVRNGLVPLFEAIGMVEAHMGIAKVFNKHKALPVRLCFVNYITGAQQPSVVMHNFWNMFIDPTKVVANSIEFNSHNAPRNMILTGPNTAGKSTIIKSVALNMLLAQTFGIAAADQADITLMHILRCHMNITDDIATGESLFAAEVSKAKEILNDIRSISKQQFMFVIMDELFNGTNAEGGSEAAYKFSDDLSKYTNLILTIATHFEKLTELPENSSAFINMFVGAHLDENKLIRPFKLTHGIWSDPGNKILHAILEREGIYTAQAAAAA